MEETADSGQATHTTANAREGTVLWDPSVAVREHANLTRYMRYLQEHRGLTFTDVDALWRWSVAELEDFWASLWDYFDVQASQLYTVVLANRTMPGARWFEGAKLNFAEHIFRAASSERPALLFRSEREPLRAISWNELRSEVGTLAQALRDMGVTRGDRVAAYIPNTPHAVVAFLACASIGAIWSACSPDFGANSVIDRFRQIEPAVLFAVDGYQYNGQVFDRRPVVAELRRSLPTLRHTVLIPYEDLSAATDSVGARHASSNLDEESEPGTMNWDDLMAASEHAPPLDFEQVPFDHPLWVLYSSGTTGLPKPIVQGHGGILLEQHKAIGLGYDVHPGDRFFWYTTTGWMMWNVVVGSLLTGATAVLYDGSPRYPSLDALWSLAEEARLTHFGTSAGFLMACHKAGLAPGRAHDLRALVRIGSTGSPLPVEGFTWVYEHVKRDVWLGSSSGGTDICTGLVGGCVLLPVRAGELQTRALGVHVQAFDEEGRSVVGEVGELVVTEPMPSMPLYFWNDADGKRYHDSYFDRYPGVWRHGDWIKILPSGSAVIYGRSDSTINRMGVRMGTSEIYRAVEELSEVVDSLIVGVERPNGGYYMPLFVVLREGATLDGGPDGGPEGSPSGGLRERIRERIRRTVSPHHVPDAILVVPEIPYTLSGKKLEVPVKKLLMGVPAEQALTVDATRNPSAIAYFTALAAELAKRH